MTDTIIDILQKLADKTPDKDAYIFYTFNANNEKQSVSFKQLNDLVMTMAANLSKIVNKHDRALFFIPLDQGLEFIKAFYACLACGVIAIPTFPPRPKRELDVHLNIIKNASPKIVITTEKFMASVKPKLYIDKFPKDIAWVSIESLLKQPLHKDKLKVNMDGNDIAFLQYTSGSTSMPKGVIVRHKNIIANEAMIKSSYQHDENSTFCGWLPFYHDMGLIGNVMQPMYIGATSVLFSPTSFLQAPLRWIQLISKHKAHTSGGPNFAYELCIKYFDEASLDGIDLSSWKVAFNGAEPVCAETITAFFKRYKAYSFSEHAMYPSYGMAEATLFICGCNKTRAPKLLPVNNNQLQQNKLVVDNNASNVLVSNGFVHTEQTIKIVEPTTKQCLNSGEVGEIWLNGPNICDGYWENDDVNRNVFHQPLYDGSGAYFRTGDLGVLHEGELYITGRLKDLIIIRGRNYYPQDLEQAIKHCHEKLTGKSCAISIIENNIEQLIILAELKRHHSVDDYVPITDSIKATIANKFDLDTHRVVLVKTHSVPLTSSGKVQRQKAKMLLNSHQLPVLYANDISSNAEPVVQLNDNFDEEEKAIINTIAVELAIDENYLDVTKSFYTYGVDSIKIANIANQLSTALNKEVRPELIFESDSIAHFLQLLKTTNSIKINTTASVNEQNDALTFGQKSILALELLYPESQYYTLTLSGDVSGQFNPALFKETIFTLLDNEPLLRLMITASAPVKTKINETLALHYHHEQFSELLAMESFHDQTLQSKLNPIGDQLFKIYLLECHQHYKLLFKIHHIISDFHTVELLLQKINQIYTNLFNHQTCTLKQTSLFSQFIETQEHYLNTDAAQKANHYWQQQIEKYTEPMKLPYDYVSSQTVRAHDVIHFTYSSQLTDAVIQLARSSETTVYTILLSAIYILLYQITNARQLVVGSPVSIRDSHHFNETIGYFINTLPLFCDIDPTMSVSEFIQQIKSNMGRVRKYQAYPIALLNSAKERQATHSPVLFTYQNSNYWYNLTSYVMGKSTDIQLNNFSINDCKRSSFEAEAELDIAMTIIDCAINGYMIFDKNKFDSKHVAFISECLESLLEQMTTNSTQTISALDTMPAAFQAFAINAFNHHPQSYDNPKTLVEQFHETAKQYANKTAVNDHGTTHQFNDLLRDSDALAVLIKELVDEH